MKLNHFKYLGCVLSSSGPFNKGIDTPLSKAQQALFCLKTVFHESPEVSITTKIKLFNSFVVQILTYACEVLGFNKADQLDI